MRKGNSFLTSRVGSINFFLVPYLTSKQKNISFNKVNIPSTRLPVSPDGGLAGKVKQLSG
jgi:hypothetical protein